MGADLDALCTVIYCTTDDPLPEARPNFLCSLVDYRA